MKKRIRIILLTFVVAVSAFALMAGGCGLSGTEVSKDVFEKAAENASKAFKDGPVTFEFSSATKNVTENEYIYEQKDSTANYSKSFSKVTDTMQGKAIYIFEGDKAYLKIESTQEKIQANGSSFNLKEFSEQYIEKIGKDLYTIQKDTSGKWSKTNHDIVSEDYRISDTVGLLSIASIMGFENFADYEYKSGRYYVKNDVIMDSLKKTESKNNDNYKYTFEYGNCFFYCTFNGDGLISGYEQASDMKKTETYTYTGGFYSSTTNSTKKTTDISNLQIKITYSGRVNIPAYTK